MKGIFKFSLTELRLLFREKSFYFWTIVLPIAFVFIFSGIGNKDNKNDIKSIIYYKNYDNDKYSKELFEYFKKENLVLKENKKNKKLDRELIIPKDFSKDIESGKKIKLEFHIKGSEIDSKSIQIKISLYRAIYKFLINKNLKIKNIKDILSIKTKWAGKSSYIPTGIIHQLPATIITFLLFNLLIFGGTNIVKLRQRGMLERYVITPLGRFGIWSGLFITNILISIIVISVITIMSIILFSVNFGFLTLFYMLIILITYSFFVSSLGILIGSVFKRLETVAGTSVLLANVLAALGGCWWPIEIVPDFMKKIAKLLPTGWAMEATDKLLFYKFPFSSVIENIILLLLIGFIFTVFSVKYFKTEKI